MEDKTFEHLEERVARAAEALRRLKKENASLAQQAQQAQAAQATLAERLASAQKDKETSGSAARDLAAARAELKALRTEREQVAQRVARIVSLLDELES